MCLWPIWPMLVWTAFSTSVVVGAVLMVTITGSGGGFLFTSVVTVNIINIVLTNCS